MEQAYHDSIFWVEVDRIKPNPFQPRREFDQQKLQELAESIKQYGLLQPITVTRKDIPLENGGWAVEYELIAGERRLRASKLAGLTQMPAIIRTKEDSDEMKLELAIIENLQREDLNPMDRARALARLVTEFGFKHHEVGQKIGRSREYVSNSLRLLQLPEVIQKHIADGTVSEGHTRPLLMLNDRPEEQEVLLKEILLKRLTVREAESIARRTATEKVRNRSLINPGLIEIEKDLTQTLGTRVLIEPKEVGGRLVISYFSDTDLDQIHSMIKSMGHLGIPPIVQEKVLQAAQSQMAEKTQNPPETPAAPIDVFADSRPSVSEFLREQEKMQADAQARAAQAAQQAAPEAAAQVYDVHAVSSETNETPLSKEEEAVYLNDATVEDAKEWEKATDANMQAQTDAEEKPRTEEQSIYSVRNFSI